MYIYYIYIHTHGGFSLYYNQCNASENYNGTEPLLAQYYMRQTNNFS